MRKENFIMAFSIGGKKVRNFSDGTLVFYPIDDNGVKQRKVLEVPSEGRSKYIYKVGAFQVPDKTNALDFELQVETEERKASLLSFGFDSDDLVITKSIPFHSRQVLNRHFNGILATLYDSEDSYHFESYINIDGQRYLVLWYREFRTKSYSIVGSNPGYWGQKYEFGYITWVFVTSNKDIDQTTLDRLKRLKGVMTVRWFDDHPENVED